MKNKHYALMLVIASSVLLLLPLAVTQPSSDTVTFMLDFNINGIENDIAEVDGNGVGIYYPGDIENPYVCLADDTATFGIASSEINYISLSKPDNYTMQLSQNYTGNKFILPITRGGCNIIRNKMSAIASNQFLVPYASFIARRSVTYLILNYSLDIVGDFSKKNDFILTLEKNNSQIIVRSR